MPVTITADQARPEDIISDRRGSLWRRQAHDMFELVSLASGALVADYGIEPDDEHEINAANLDFFHNPLTLLMRAGKPVGDELPAEPELPKTVEFEWYLHGGKPYEERSTWASRLGFTITDEFLDKLGQPFYEVTLSCSLDTETGQVTILGAK